MKRIKKITLLSILLLLFTAVKNEYVNGGNIASDVFPLQNAKWTGFVRDENEKQNLKHTYFSYVIKGDTVIDDIKRSKLYYIPDIYIKDSLLIGYFHVIDSIVYYQIRNLYSGDSYGLELICDEYGSNYPLYDFSLKKGDTYYQCGFPQKLEVTSIEYIEIGGKLRKKIIFDWDIWIEGMGSIKGFFEGKYEPCICSSVIEYICFSVNDEVLYMNSNYSECAYSGYSIEQIKHNNLTITPNPMKSYATIDSGDTLDLLLFYNINGVLVREQICNEMQIVIHKENLPQGIYFLKCFLKTGDMQTIKLIIK